MNRLAACFILLGLVTSSAWGTNLTYYVDQKHPQAADTNLGTNEAAPLKTIQAAVDKVAAGDTILVKAGVYRESVLFKSSGTYASGRSWGQGEPWPTRIVLSACGDDQVIIDGSDPVPPASWQPVEGKPKVYVAVVKPQTGGLGAPLHGVVAYWRGQRLTPNLTQTAGQWTQRVPEPEQTLTYTYDGKTTNLYVNLGGADPRTGEAGMVEAAVRSYGVSARRQQFITLRKLTVRRTGWRAIEAAAGGVEPIVEDCEVYDSENGITAQAVFRPIIRRCVVHDVSQRAFDVRGQAALISDNVAYAFAQDWFKERNWYYVYAYTVFGGEYARVFHNLALQPQAHMNPIRGGGFWPDAGCPGHFWVGNAAYRCHTGFYVECPALGNTVQWNTCLWNNGGIALRQNAGNLVAENYLLGNDIGISMYGADQPIPDMAHNLFSHNWFKGNRYSLTAQNELGTNVQTRNYAQRNIHESWGAAVAVWPGGGKTLEEFQKGTGNDLFGRHEPINLDELGLVWVRVDGLDISHEAIPMFGNPTCERLGFMVDAGPYFWRRGDAAGPDSYPENWPMGRNPPGFNGGEFFSPLQERNGAGAGWLFLAPVTNTPVRKSCLLAASMEPDKPCGPEGAGWWSPSLPAASGSTIDIGLWMKIDDVKPVAGSACGAVVYVEWSDWHGQNKSRSYLVGEDAGAKPERPELATGTHAWTEVRGSVTAPANARRMALFMGVRNCTGRAFFDEIRTLAARPL